MLTVFEANACDTPYPATHLDDLAWRQLVIKALFVGAPLWRVYGLDKRLDAELARMAMPGMPPDDPDVSPLVADLSGLPQLQARLSTSTNPLVACLSHGLRGVDALATCAGGAPPRPPGGVGGWE